MVTTSTDNAKVPHNLYSSKYGKVFSTVFKDGAGANECSEKEFGLVQDAVFSAVPHQSSGHR
jgi:hypothetical protein